LPNGYDLGTSLRDRHGISGSLVSINNGGHTWPRRHPFNIGFFLGETTQEIEINEILWKFFSSQTTHKEN
jgi:polyhydroxybutyrate depolymerase